MSFWIKKLSPWIFFFTLTGFYTPSGVVQSGGEIPWPLSNQEVVSATHSQGLWKLGNQDGDKIFNVEIVTDPRSRFDWIRVAEMDVNTWEVVSWGEGFFSHAPKIYQGPSSFFDVSVRPGGANDKMGRYLTMFPNGDLKNDSYLVRLVEVKTSLGNVLGLSILDFRSMQFDHYLGTRMMTQPLTCDEKPVRNENLTCHFFD